MILDTSAIIAILCGEPDAERYLAAMQNADRLAVGAPTLVEAGIVAHAKLGDDGPADLEHFLRRLHVDVLPFGETEASIARHAFRAYGKGRHPARLNFGDCLSYAMAAACNEPLLYQGEDFSRTPLRSALEMKASG